MDTHAYYTYRLLEHLEETPNLTNRFAAAKLGVSIKLTHVVIKKLLDKGWIHATARDGRSMFYFLTPTGIAEKVRLTYEFLEFTKQFYKQGRKLSSEVCQQLTLSGVKNVALLGSGDLAEIVYLGISEHHLQLTHVFDVEPTTANFMQRPVQSVDALPTPGKGSFEKIIVALYDSHQPMLRRYLPSGIEADDRFVWAMEPGELITSIEKKAPVPSASGSGNQQTNKKA